MARPLATITGSPSRKPCLPDIMKWTPDETTDARVTVYVYYIGCLCVDVLKGNWEMQGILF